MGTNSSSSPILWLNHLTKPCPQQARWLYEKKPKTFPVDAYDTRSYTIAVTKLQNFFLSTGWTVVLHRPITASFGSVQLGHYFDLFLSKNAQQVAVIIKPEDRSYYTDLYIFSLLVLQYAHIPATLMVYESTTYRFVPKSLNSFTSSEQLLQARISALFAPYPSRTKSKICSYCPFGECEHHPVNNHHTQSSIVERIIQELEELVQ